MIGDRGFKGKGVGIVAIKGLGIDGERVGGWKIGMGVERGRGVV